MAVCESVGSCEVVVEYEHVDANAVDLLGKLGGGCSRRYDCHVVLGFDQPPQACEHGRMIIENGDTQH